MDQYNEAVELYGKQKVDEVIEIVNISDPEDACSIIEMLYFEISN